MTRHREPRPPLDAPELAAAVAGLRALDGNSHEVDQLAQRLGPQLATQPPTGAALAPTSTFKLLSGLVVGVALLGWGGFWAASGRELESRAPRTLPAVRVRGAQPERPAALIPNPSEAEAPQAMPEKPEPPREPVARRSRAQLGGIPAAEPGQPTGSAESELKLLSRAQAALATAPRRALDLCEEHARHYARGVFAQEREVIALEAEMKVGRADAAARRAQRFLRAFPRSTHGGRVRALLAEGESASDGDNGIAKPTPN